MGRADDFVVAPAVPVGVFPIAPSRVTDRDRLRIVPVLY
jgi:hypothetical protein